MKIGLDVDDVLADFISKFLAIASKKFGISAEKRPIDWEMSNLGLTQEQIAEVWQYIKDTKDFWTTLYMPPVVSSAAVWECDRQHTVFFITSRMPTLGDSLERQTAKWIRDYIGIAYPTVIVSSEKGKLASALGLDYFADDRPKNCEEVLAASPNTKVYLIAAAHNRDYTHPKIVRLKDVNEFLEIINN